MLAYIIRRLFAIIPTFFGITIVVFVVLNMAPGGPVEQALQKIRYSGIMGGESQAMAGSASATAKETAVNEEILEALQEQYGFDKPVILNPRVEDRRVAGIDRIGALIFSIDQRPESKSHQDLEEMGTAVVPYLVPALIDDQGSAQGVFNLVYENGLDKIHERIAYLTLAKPDLKPKDVTSEEFNRYMRQAEKHIAKAVEADKESVFEKLIEGRQEAAKALEQDAEKLSIDNFRNLITAPLLEFLGDKIGEEAVENRETLAEWLQQNKSKYTEEHIQSLADSLAAGDQQAGNELKQMGKITLPVIVEKTLDARGDAFINLQPVLQAVADKTFTMEDVSDVKVHDTVRKTIDRWWEDTWLLFTEVGILQRILMFFTYTQYGIWIGNIFTLDFGNSFTYERPVIEVIISKMPISVWFGVTSFLLTYMVCIPLGVIKAVRDGTPFDYSTSILLFILYSIPGFVLGVALIVLFGGGSYWSLIPIGGFTSDNFDQLSLIGKFLDMAWHMIGPLVSYMVASFTMMTLLMKNSIIEEISKDYCRTARAKGVDDRRVYLKHALRNSLIPLATGIGGFLTLFFAGSFLIEKVFNLDGLGLLGYTSLLSRDFPILLGLMVILSVLGLLGRLISDLVYVLVDPRIDFT